MPSDFASQIGVTRLPNLTGDGRDGFPSRAQHDWCVAQYLNEMCEKKRGKALIDKNLYDRILAVCFDDSNKKTETAQFRWWVRRTFKLYAEAHGHYLMHENRPIAVKEQIYDILVYAHAECGHGGRDKTSAAVRRYFSWIPKDVVSRFVSVCPGCHARTQKDDEYFSNKGIDGYYPVHAKVRQMSIDSRQCTVADYKNTASYQPMLATGMVKILKALEACEDPVAKPHLEVGTSLENQSFGPGDGSHQTNYLAIPGPQLSFSTGSNCPSPLSLPRTPTGSTSSPSNLSLGSDFGRASDNGESFSQETESSGNNISSITTSNCTEVDAPQPLNVLGSVDGDYSGSRAQSPNIALENSNEKLSEEEILAVLKEKAVSSQSTDSETSNSKKKTVSSPSAARKSHSYHFSHIPKPPRPSAGRKTSSKSKEYKKVVLAETFIQSPISCCPGSHYGSQSSIQSLSYSEDDGASKSSSSSSTTNDSVGQPLELWQHHPASQITNYGAQQLQALPVYAQFGPLDTGMNSFLSDFSNSNNLQTHVTYLGQSQSEDFLGGLSMTSEGGNSSNGVSGDYTVPELLKSHIFDNSPVDYGTLINLQTPVNCAEPLRNDFHQAAFAATDTWSMGNGSHVFSTAPEPCSSGLYVPLAQGNFDVFSTGIQSASSESITPQSSLIFDHYESLKGLPNCVVPSNFGVNSLGINFSHGFQIGADLVCQPEHDNGSDTFQGGLLHRIERKIIGYH